MGDWISVKERLPSSDGRYLVTLKRGTYGNYVPKHEHTIVKINRYSVLNGWQKPVYFDKELEKDSYEEVLAWMELPEEYEE